MSERLDRKRILIFLAFAFGIAWSFGLVVYLTGGLVDSPELIPGTGATLALVLLAVGYMWAPAEAHLLTRLVTHEGWEGMQLKPRLKEGWPYWIAAWFVPAIATVAGGALFFALFPQYFDASLSMITEMLDAAGQELPLNPWLFVLIQTLSGVLLSPLINGLFTFGEEFGWRGYLQPKLMPLGARKAMFLMGLIWGVWHWPVIAMGHNYGLDYPGAPWLGMLMMVGFTFFTGTFLGWATWRGGSVWPAVIGHAALNGISSLPVIFMQGDPNPLLGPLPVGLIGAAGWAVIAIWIFVRIGRDAQGAQVEV